MSKTIKRLMIAFGISLSGFATTITWYNLSEKAASGTSNAKQIARLVYTLNDVQKKSVQRIIWQPATDNEVLRVGEAIRTASNSEARIEFLNSGTAIDLEPDSAIVLEENDGKLSLDFLKGNILVKSEGSTAGTDSEITLKSGDKKIALGNSELSLGKNKTGELDLQIIKGSVNGANANLSNQIKFKNFDASAPLYTENNGEGLKFEWEPLPKGYQVFLEAGTKREDLKPVPGAVGPGETGQLQAKMKLGKSYFKLVARSQDPSLPEKSSPVMRTNVLAKIAPQPLFPEKDAVLSVNKLNPEVKFLWSNSANYKRTIIEISTSPDLKLNSIRQDLENTSEYKMKIDKSATFYWRISGVLDGKKEVVASPVKKVTVNYVNELLPPELEWPKNNDRIPQDKIIHKGMTLTWKPVPGALRYRFQLLEVADATTQSRSPSSNKKIIESEVQLLQYTVEKLKPGTYSWSVASVGDKNETSKPSETRTFTVQALPVLNWADGKTKEDYYYLSLKPSMSLKWEKGDPKATQWQIKIFKSESDEKPIVRKVTSQGAELEVAQDGSYLAEVEALDDRGNTLARSAKRHMRVAPAPLLPAPQFAADVPKEVEATGSGTAAIQWQEVQGAKKYVLLIKSANGANEKEFNFDSVQGSVKGLMPGEYKMSLRSVDSNGRIGPEGEARTLKVPSQSNLRAPKLKGVKFK